MFPSPTAQLTENLLACSHVFQWVWKIKYFNYFRYDKSASEANNAKIRIIKFSNKNRLRTFFDWFAVVKQEDLASRQSFLICTKINLYNQISSDTGKYRLLGSVSTRCTTVIFRIL